MRNLDLSVRTGERVLLIGASGSGKSTLLMALAGLLDPSGGGDAEGTLLVDGSPPDRARGGVGLVFQDPESQIVLGTAGDDVAFGLENRCVPTPEIWPRVDRALDAVAFPYPPGHRTDALSRGEKQRLALAGVVALEPRVLLLDEPTSNLDPDGAATFRRTLAALAAGVTTMLLVEHRVDDVLAFVDRVVVVASASGVVADGTPDEVFGDDARELERLGVWVPSVREPRSDPIAGAAPRRSGSPLLLADGVAYRHRGAACDALSPTDVALSGGEALAILGPNGSGKSTLALLLGGLLRPSGGTVTAGVAFAPEMRERTPWRWEARQLVRRIGSVFQAPEHQFVAGRVDQELMVGPRRIGLARADAERRAAQLMDRLELGDVAAANPHTLSGGEQRRLSVATALATEPDVLLLDEPTFGLDRHAHGELSRLLAESRDAGRAVAFATHDWLLVDAVADRELMLARRDAP